jgi:hypothetical protein
MNQAKQRGWLLFETLLATVIGFVVLTAATQFFFTSTRVLTQLVEQWHRLGQYEKWRLWMRDLLDVNKAQEHCGDEAKIGVQRIEKNAVNLRSCRWLEQRWQWVTTRYYLRKKKGVSYLYEKTADQSGVAWIPGITQLQASLQPAGVKPGCQLLTIDWRSEKRLQSKLESRFIFTWCYEKTKRSR